MFDMAKVLLEHSAALSARNALCHVRHGARISALHTLISDDISDSSKFLDRRLCGIIRLGFFLEKNVKTCVVIDIDIKL